MKKEFKTIHVPGLMAQFDDEHYPVLFVICESDEDGYAFRIVTDADVTDGYITNKSTDSPSDCDNFKRVHINESQKAISEIENAMERWHHARDNDDETLQKINDIMVSIGRLEWFNKGKEPK